MEINLLVDLNKCCDKIKEHRDVLQSLGQGRIKLQNLQTKLSEINAASSTLRSDISKIYSKLEKIRNTYQQQKDSIQEALNKATEKKRLQSVDQSNDEKKIEMLQQLIQEMEDKISRMQRDHRNNMKVLWKRFQELRTHADDYRRRLQHEIM
jgi:chromosome segregation ATPase